MKKTIAILMVLVLACTFVFANGSKEESAPAAESSVKAEDLNGITLQMWHAQSKENGKAMDMVVELFNNTNPYGITVVPTSQGGYGDTHKKILGGLAAGNYPNIGQAYNNNMMHYLPSGALMDLTDYFTDDFGISAEDFATIEPAYLGENSAFPDGGQYAVSLGKSTEAFFYNKTFFEENGLKVPTTLDELTEVAAAASAITGKPSFGLDSTDNWGIYGPMNFGAKYADVNGNVFLFDENNIEATKAFYEWWENGIDNGWFRTAGDDRYCSGPYSSGDLQMFIGSCSGVNYVKPDGFEFGVAHIPVGTDPHVIQQGGNFCGFKTGDAAVDLATSIFLEFLYTPEAGALYAANTGYLPANHAGLQEKAFLDCIAKGGINGETKAVCASYPQEWKTYDPVFAESYDVRKALAYPLQGIEVSDVSIDDLIAETQKKLAEILGK